MNRRERGGKEREHPVGSRRQGNWEGRDMMMVHGK